MMFTIISSCADKYSLGISSRVRNVQGLLFVLFCFHSRAMGSYRHLTVTSWLLEILPPAELWGTASRDSSVTEIPRRQQENIPRPSWDWWEKCLIRMRFPKWHSTRGIPLDWLKQEMHVVEYHCQSSNTMAQENSFIHVRKKNNPLFLTPWIGYFSESNLVLIVILSSQYTMMCRILLR